MNGNPEKKSFNNKNKNSKSRKKEQDKENLFTCHPKEETNQAKITKKKEKNHSHAYKL